MKKSGGILAIISGILGIFATIATGVFGGFVVAIGGEKGDIVGTMFLAGSFFSLVSIVLGTICMNAKRKIAGVLLVISSFGGIFSGGLIVAVFMLMSLFGGILSIIGTKKEPGTI